MDRPQSTIPHPAWLEVLVAAPDSIHRWAMLAWDRAAAVPGNRYDAALAERTVEVWPRLFFHTEGRWARKPFVLADWQAAIVRLLAGWLNADGFRVFRRLLLWVGKKNGKSEFLASLAIWFWLADKEFGGQGYTFALNEKQANIVFEKMKTMVGLSPILSKKIKIFGKSLYCGELKSKFELLPGNIGGKHGISMSVAVGDEMHEWTAQTLLTTLHQSSAARDQPIELLGSTAGFRGRGAGWELYDESVAILEGRLHQPQTLVVIYAIGPDDDWTDEATWYKANPNLAIGAPKIEYLREECSKAKENPRLENDFRRYHCNEWTEQAVRWIPLRKWDANCVIPWREMRARMLGRMCFGALDLSSVRDITAWVLLFPPDAAFDRWCVLPRFFVPEQAMEERVKRDRVSYDVWVREGAMEATEGDVVDQDHVKHAVQEDGEAFDIRKIGYDPWNAVKLALELQNDGAEMVAMRQGIPTLGEPSKSFERLVWSAGYDHGGHPTLRWMAGNVAVKTDSNGNFKPDKQKSAEKIDGIVAVVMDQGLADADGAKLSVYEERGIRTI